MARAVISQLLLAGINVAGVPLAGGKVYTYDAGTTNNRSTYTTQGKTVVAANPIVLDSEGKAQIYLDGSYKFVIKTSADVTVYTYDNVNSNFQDSTTETGGTSSGSANTYNISVSPALDSYVSGQVFTFVSHQTNTGNSTFNVNSLGAKNIKSNYFGSTDLLPSEIISGRSYQVMYDGTNMVLLKSDYDYSRSMFQAASGTTQGAGLAIRNKLTFVTSGSAGVNEAVTMFAATANQIGTRVIITNGSGITLKLFPASGCQWSGSALNASINLTNNTELEAMAYSATIWLYQTRTIT